MNSANFSSWQLDHVYDAVQGITTNPTALLFITPALTLATWILYAHFASPLRKFPGPFLASWTNLWRMYYAYTGQMHIITKKMHEKYGPVVRMAPNYLDIDYPSLVKTCFDTKGVWKKTEWHGVSGAKFGSKIIYNIFSETDPAEHARIKKPIAKYFSASGVASMEPHINKATALFARQIGTKFAGKDNKMGQPFNFGDWCLFFSWDAVAETTTSNRLGYLEKGCDFDGTLDISSKASQYLVTVGMYWKLDYLLDKNPIYRIGPPSFTSVSNICLKLLMDRVTGKDGHDASKPDFMDRYLEAKQEHPEVVDDMRLVSYILVNLAAGADTSAAALRTIFYLSLKHPAVWKRLEADILAAPFAQPGAQQQLPASYAQARAIPYLEAVVKESLRLVPGNMFSQERYVPAGGPGLLLPDGRGTYVPPGTAVGFSAWVLHRNRDVWGADAAAFRPARYLRDEAAGETAEQHAARLRAYGESDLSFGAGSRRCIGMNLGLMEVYKTVATLIALFEFELADPDKEWDLKAELFPRATGVELRMRLREGMTLPE